MLALRTVTYCTENEETPSGVHARVLRLEALLNPLTADSLARCRDLALEGEDDMAELLAAVASLPGQEAPRRDSAA